MKRYLFALTSFALPLVLATFCPAQNSWNGLRGDGGTGLARGGRLANANAVVNLALKWKHPLGSGYSSVVVAGERVLVTHKHSSTDNLSAFDGDSGEQLWSVKLDETFAGRNGSFDGPLSTPCFDTERVFALSAQGRLIAVNISDGKIIWERHLTDDFDCTTPMYGFATSPLIAGDRLLIQIGSKAGMVAALDPSNGETKWLGGVGGASSQTPLITTVHGKACVVACDQQRAIGLDLSSGETLFSFAHGGGNGGAMMPVELGPGRFLLTNDDAFSTVFRVVPADEGFKTQPDWQERSIKNTYNVPVLHTDSLYAYSTRIFTCVDPATGKPRWKSRQPGDGFLVGIGRHLLLCTKEGRVVLVEPSSDAYQPVAELDVFDELVWSIPAVTGDTLYVRSLGELARIDLVPADGSAVAESSNVPVGPRFAELLTSVGAAESPAAKRALIQLWREEHPDSPYVEGDLAHFVYQGNGQDVALACDVLGARQEQPMTRVPDTDFFYTALQLPVDQRVNYLFLVDFVPTIDPRNQRSFTSTLYEGEMELAVRLQEEPLRMSWFGMPKWKLPSFRTSTQKIRAGQLKPFDIELPNEDALPIEVYLPPGYEDSEVRYPTLYVFDGSNAIEHGKVPDVADRWFTVQPDQAAIIVFLKGNTGGFAPFDTGLVSQHVVPWIDEKFRTIDTRESRATAGSGFAASLALSAAVGASDQFGSVGLQSPLVFDQVRQQLVAALQRVESPTKLYIDWGRYDMFNPVENWDVRTMSNELASEAKKNRAIQLLGGQVNDSTDWSSWSNRYEQILNLPESN